MHIVCPLVLGWLGPSSREEMTTLRNAAILKNKGALWENCGGGLNVRVSNVVSSVISDTKSQEFLSPCGQNGYLLLTTPVPSSRFSVT